MSVSTSLQSSNEDSYFSLGAVIAPEKDPQEKPENVPDNWEISILFDLYTSKQLPDDRMKIYRIDYRYTTESNWIFGGGVGFTSATADKIITFEPNLKLGKIWQIKPTDVEAYSPEIEGVITFANHTIYKTIENTHDVYTLELKKMEIEVQAALIESVQFRISATRYFYTSDFSLQRSSGEGSRFIARPRGQLLNTLVNLPKSFATAEVNYDWNEKYSTKIYYSRSQEEISQEFSTDQGISLIANRFEPWSFEIGTGLRRSSSGTSAYALAGLIYQF